jgi:hypothetical protein
LFTSYRKSLLTSLSWFDRQFWRRCSSMMWQMDWAKMTEEFRFIREKQR